MLKDRGILTCSECGTELTDGNGNIMVNKDAFVKHHRYTDLRLICKPCTMKMDVRGDGLNYHHIWELYSVRDAPFVYFGQVINDLVHPTRYKWDAEAVDNFVDILIELLPTDDARGLIKSYFAGEEWDGEGWRTERFRERRNIARERERLIEREKRAKEKPIPYVKPSTDIEAW